MGILQWDKNLKVRIVGETVNSILFWMFFPFMTIYFVESFGKQVAGLLMFIPPILGIFANLYGGYAADRYGRKKMMITSLAAQSLMLIFFGLSLSPWLDYVAFTGLSIMSSLYRPASAAMVADLVPVEKRRPVFAAFYTSINVGVVFGPALGAFFFFNYKQYLIFTSAAVTFTLFLVMSKVLRETLPSSSMKKIKGLRIIEQLNNYKLIFSDKVFFIYIIAGILITQVFMQIDVYMGVYLREYIPTKILNLSLFSLEVTGAKMYGWLVSENGLLVVIFGVAISSMIRKWSDERALVTSALLFGSSFLLMGLTTNTFLLILLMGSFTLAELIRTPVIQNFITAIAPEDQRGQYLGASSLQFSVGRAIAPFAIFLSGYFHPIVIFSYIFALSIISAYLYRLMFKVHRKRIVENESIFENYR